VGNAHPTTRHPAPRTPNGLEPSSPKDFPHRESGISQVPSHPFTDSQGLWKNPFRRAESEGRSPKGGVRRAESEGRSPKSGVRTPNSELRTPYSELRTPYSEWARALESEGSFASRIRNLAGSLPFSHRLSG
jgi:hypothetical protein